jgi:hypothetical protein
MAVRPTRKPLIIGREHLRGRLRAGDIIATVYKGHDDELWVRSETITRIIKHRDGTTTLVTDYTKRPRLLTDNEAPILARHIAPRPLAQFKEETRRP